MKFKILNLVIIYLLLSACGKIKPGMKVTNYQVQNSIVTYQPKVPVLKLKRDNPILRICLSHTHHKRNLRTNSITVNIKATDIANDIKTVRIWSSGNDSIWRNNSSRELFGIEAKPESEISFEGKSDLLRGNNYFWVSLELSTEANLHNTVSARCSKIEFSDKSIAEHSPVNHEIEQRIGVAVRQHMDDNVNTYRIPGLSTTKRGTLLAVYDARHEGSRDLQGDIDIGVSRSVDGGNTWEPMKMGLDMGEWGDLPEKFNGVSDPTILVDPNTESIFLTGLWMYGVIDKHGKWIEGLTEERNDWNHQWQNKGTQPGTDVKQSGQFLIAKSTDDGQTWSEARNLTEMCKNPLWWLLAPAPGRGITLSDGTLVIPSQGRDEKGFPFSNITYSKDGGETWTTSNHAYSNTTESQVVQLSDGSIMLNMRYNENRNNDSDTNGRVVMITKDLGETWTEHPSSRSALIESTCMASIHEHIYQKNGKQKSILLFSNPNTKKGRHHMTIKVSFDEGKTWPKKYWMLLDEGNSRGYSCLTSIDENTIGILYEGSQADMTFESIPLAEILDK